MAFVYSTTQEITNSSYGNIDMAVNIFRGECTRTETGVTFNFGVSFTPCGKTTNEGGSGTWTSNSVAAWYGGVQKFAQMAHGEGTHTVFGTYYYATDMTYEWGKNQQNTTEVTCYTFTASNIAATTTSVNVTVGVGWADFAGTNKGNLTFSLTIPEFHGNVGTPTVTITDNGDNTFTVSGTNGANGANNTATTIFSWGYDTNYSNSGKVSNQALTANASNATKTVYAKAVTTGAHGSSRTATTSLAVKNYRAPSQAGKPVISYEKSRLTIKESWDYSWTASTATNASSPIRGYRLRVYKNNSAIAGLAYNTSSAVLTKGSGTHTYVDTEDSDVAEISFDPATMGFAPGNKVKFSVQAYTKYGTGSTLTGTVSTSDELTILNAGIVRAKTSTGFVEGVAHVKVNGAWQEAEVVKVKTASGWQEAE